MHTHMELTRKLQYKEGVHRNNTAFIETHHTDFIKE